MLPLAVAFAVAGLLATACSSKEDADPRASDSATARPSSAPSAPTLTRDESRAVDEALADADEADAVFRRLAKDPRSAMADEGKKLDVLKRYYYSPQINDAARIIRELAEKDGRYEGAERVEWRVPTEVDLTGSTKVIRYDLCSSLGTFRVFNGDSEIEQERSPLRFSVTANPAYDGRRIVSWRTSKIEESGSCAAS